MNSHSYKAISGKPINGKFDYSIERQKRKNEGPIPEGKYWITPSELQGIVSLSGKIRHPIWYIFGRSSWGDYRISIHPYPDTETYCRGGFFIHGGKKFGSAGCIDLSKGMKKFVNDLREELKKKGIKYNCYIPLQVRYPLNKSNPQKGAVNWIDYLKFMSIDVTSFSMNELETLIQDIEIYINQEFTECSPYNIEYLELLKLKESLVREWERRKFLQAYNTIIQKIQEIKDNWKDRLKKELKGFTNVESWVLKAIGNFVGLPYAIAHRFYKSPEEWRNLYKKGIYPVAVVCDQLGEITQRLARGIEYGNLQGLTDHYFFI